jgi:predicted ATPase
MFIVMEYIQGRELREIVGADGRLPLPFDRIIDYACQIASGLQAAHEKGIIHRDIKSANIMITAKGQVKIMDFGLAKLVGGLHLTKERSTLGTAAYMSPEQAQGKPVDHRTDIWSLGVVLYEMITGQRPHKGESEQAVIYSIIIENPEPLSSIRKEIPSEIEQFVEKALEKEPANRYQSMEEFLADLKKIGRIPRAPNESELPPKNSIRSNLPKSLTSFVGRKNEIGEIQLLLSKVRLLTLTGAGGTGKTRLGIQATTEFLGEFDDGIVFVALANIANAELVTSTIAQTLGIRVVGDISVMDKIKELLYDKRVLLILDNFEHVVSSAPLVGEILVSCPKLKILVTSREALHISGEHEFPVGPLNYPDSKAPHATESVGEYEAVDLFVQRARAVKPDFTLSHENEAAIIEICARLDGLPLAIELAAARVKLFSPHAIKKRLAKKFDLLRGGARDLPQRQQTLRSTITWSYDLLSDDEKRLLRRITIFQGGCTLEATDAVCNSEKDLGFVVEEGLASLLDKNLLRKEDQPDLEPRFHMFETVRDFAREELDTCGEAENLQRVHRDFYLRFAEEAQVYLTGPHQKMWFDSLEQEHDNLRVAIDWSISMEPDVESAMRFGKALYRFWLVRGFLNEGRARLAEIIKMTEGCKQREPLAIVLSHAGTLAQNQGAYASARSYFSESLAIWRKLNNKKGIASLLNSLGWLAWRLGDYEEACALSLEGLDLYQSFRDKSGIATSLTNLGVVALHQGQLREAHSFYSDSLNLRQEAKDRRGIAFSLTSLGWVESKSGMLDQAGRHLQEALGLFEELGDKQLYAFALNIFGDLLHDQCEFSKSLTLMEEKGIAIESELGSKYGLSFSLRVMADNLLALGDLGKAAKLHEESLALRQATKDKWCIAQSLHRLGIVAIRQEEHELAITRLTKSLFLRSEMEDKIGTVECFEGFAIFACNQNSYMLAAELLGAAEAVRDAIGAPRPPCLRNEFDKIQSALNETLGEKTFEAVKVKARNRTIEEAIRFTRSAFER